MADQHPYSWMRRDADNEYVEPIIEHLKPLNNPYPHYGNPEEYVVHEVQCAIFYLRDICHANTRVRPIGTNSLVYCVNLNTINWPKRLGVGVPIPFHRPT